jgi:hypothetical protein
LHSERAGESVGALNFHHHSVAAFKMKLLTLNKVFLPSARALKQCENPAAKPNAFTLSLAPSAALGPDFIFCLPGPRRETGSFLFLSCKAIKVASVASDLGMSKPIKYQSGKKTLLTCIYSSHKLFGHRFFTGEKNKIRIIGWLCDTRRVHYRKGSRIFNN